MNSASSPQTPELLERVNTALLHVLPQHLMAAGMYRLMRSRTPWLKDLLISKLSQHYHIDIGEAAEDDPRLYPDFNAFFTRALKPGARPIAANGPVSPADGRISQLGTIEDGRLLQAKGHTFELDDLLAGDHARSSEFKNGRFCTVYLSPRDYHRVHIPLAGKLTSMVFVPGTLFSVSDATTQLVPSLFARNERVICYFDTDMGPMAVVLVGAIFVGSMQTIWHGEVRGERGQPTCWRYRGDQQTRFDKGDEIGRFNMGSTVITLLTPDAPKWLGNLGAGAPVQVGQALCETG